MKKLLSGIAALAAAGMLASGAQAADPISIGVGGFFHAAVSVANEDDDTNKRSFGVERDAEIYFRGSTTLDGEFIQGAGVFVQLEAETASDQIDESFAWLSGSFGQIRAGSFDGAMAVGGVYPAGVAAPMHGLFFETESPVSTGLFGEGAWLLGFDGDSAKVAWYSPTVGGAKIGVSFTPEGGADDKATSRSTAGVENEASVVVGDGGPEVKAASVSSQQSEVLGIGGNWSGDFGGASVSIGGGYTTASVEAPSDGEIDREEWVVGASASMAGITIGGNYSVDNNGKAGNNERTTLAVGATYTGMGPLTYGIRYGSDDPRAGPRDARCRHFRGVHRRQLASRRWRQRWGRAPVLGCRKDRRRQQPSDGRHHRHHDSLLSDRRVLRTERAGFGPPFFHVPGMTGQPGGARPSSGPMAAMDRRSASASSRDGVPRPVRPDGHRRGRSAAAREPSLPSPARRRHPHRRRQAPNLESTKYTI